MQKYLASKSRSKVMKKGEKKHQAMLCEPCDSAPSEKVSQYDDDVEEEQRNF